MTTAVVAIPPELSVRDAAVLLARRGFSGAPVVQPDGTLVGVLSEQDTIRALAQAAYEELPAASVRDVMRAEVETVSPDSDLFAVAQRFVQGPYRRLPVVDGGRLVGLVTRRDVALALAHLCEERCEERELLTVDAMAVRRGLPSPFPRTPLPWPTAGGSE